MAIRFIGKRCKPGHSILYFSGMCVVVTTIAPFVLQSPPVFATNLQFWLLMLPIGFGGFAAQVSDDPPHHLTMGVDPCIRG